MTTGATALARRSLRDDAASWWRKSPSRRDRRSVRHGPADGLRPASWSGNRPLAGARCRDRRPAPQPGGFVRESVRTCGRRGVGLSPGRLYLFSPLPLPSPWSVLFPAPIPGGAVGPKAKSVGFPVATAAPGGATAYRAAEGRRPQRRAENAGAPAGHDTLRGAGRCSYEPERRGSRRRVVKAVARRSDSGAGRVRVGP